MSSTDSGARAAPRIGIGNGEPPNGKENLTQSVVQKVRSGRYPL